MLPPDPPAPFSLFLDVDGTLIDIAPRPEAVVVPAGLKDALAVLDARLGGAVALVSGRTIADLDRLFDPLRLRTSGVHGAEMRLERDGTIDSPAARPLPEAVLEALRVLTDGQPGTFVENKIFTAALHYRAVPEKGPVLQRALAALVEAHGQDNLRLLPGHMVFEIKRAGFDKGVALARFLARPPFRDRTPVFLGDDVTDEPGFETVRAAGGLAYAVGGARGVASASFSSPAEVRAWLTRLARQALPAGTL